MKKCSGFNFSKLCKASVFVYALSVSFVAFAGDPVALSSTTSKEIQDQRSQKAKTKPINNYQDLNIADYFKAIIAFVDVSADAPENKKQMLVNNFSAIMNEINMLKVLKSDISEQQFKEILNALKMAYYSIFSGFGTSVINGKTGKEEKVAGFLKENPVREKLIANMTILDNIISGKADISSLQDLSKEKIELAKK